MTISWSSLPKGDAVEAIKGAGVGFFSEKGILLSVIFDEVQSDVDHQTLEFSNYVIEVTVKQGRVTYTMVYKNASLKPKKSKRTILKKQKKSIRTKKSNGRNLLGLCAALIFTVYQQVALTLA